MPEISDGGLLEYIFLLRSRRENASIVAEESSSGGASAFFAADGDLTTIWEAASGTNEWVTLDLGDPRDVTAIRLQVPTTSTPAGHLDRVVKNQEWRSFSKLYHILRYSHLVFWLGQCV